MNLKQQILDADDLPTEELKVPEWNMTVYIRSMTASERDDYEAGLLETSKKPMRERLKDMRAKLAVLCLVDEKGDRIFSDNDVKALGKKSSVVLSRIVKVAQKLNALTDDEIEEMAGNSEPGGGDDSTSD